MKRYIISFPDNDQDFEALCCAIAKEKYADYNAQQYGRSGQKQWGIDIKATNKKGNQEKIVIQCKYKKDPPKFSGNDATKERKGITEEMEHELNQALQSPFFDFDVFIYAATIPNDTKVEDFAKTLEIKYEKEVIVWTVTTIEQDILHHPRLTRLYTESGSRFGVELIDKDFIDSLEERISKNEYTPSVFKFYTGIQTKNEQWCGLFQKWDAPRQSMEAIENQLNTLFTLPYVQAKVAAVIYGEGGSGKSTLLRRIAIDCVQQEKPYTIWWVENLDAFLEYDIHSIEATHSQKHLIIIEDWYRNVGNKNKEQANAFFTWVKNFDNVLILIGDRKNNGFYRENIYENKTYYLGGSENQTIIEHIARESTDLQPIIAELKIKHALIEHSSLFVILYVIAHTFENKTLENQFNLGNIDATFRKIIHDKLMALEADDRYKGLGKAIYLCAKIYADEDLPYFTFSEKALLIATEYFGKNPEFKDRILLTKEYPLEAKSLFSILSVENTKFSPVIFTHDIIPENGIAANDMLSFDFDDYDVMQITKQLINIEEFSTYLMLWIYLNKNQLNTTSSVQFFLDFFEKHSLYISSGFYSSLFNKFNRENKRKFAIKILDSVNIYSFHPNIVSRAFHSLGNEVEGKNAALKILEHQDIFSLSKEIVCHAFKVLGNEVEGRNAALKILEHKDIFSLPKEILCHAFKILGNTIEGENTALKILEHRDIFKLPSEIISYAFKVLGNKEKKKDIALKILEHYDILNLPTGIAGHALNALGNEKGEIIVKLLEHKDIFSLSKEILCLALNILRNESEGKNIALQILAHENIINLPYQVVSRAFKIGGNEMEKKEASLKILNQENLLYLSPEIICHALNVLSKEKEGKKIALRLLEHKNMINLPYQVISRVFKVLEHEKEARYIASKILEHNDITSLPKEIVSHAFRILGYEKEGRNAALKVLENDNLLDLPDSIVCCAFRIIGNEKAKENAALKILKIENTNYLPKEIYCHVLRILRKKEEGKKAAAKILNNENIFNLPIPVVIQAFKILENQKVGRNIALKILRNNNIFGKHAEIVALSMNILKEEQIVRDVALKILTHEDILSLHEAIVNQAFRIMGNEPTAKIAAIKILEHNSFILSKEIACNALIVLEKEKEGRNAALKILNHRDIEIMPVELINRAKYILNYQHG